MRRVHSLLPVLLLVLLASCNYVKKADFDPVKAQTAELTRWANGDSNGYIMSPQQMKSVNKMLAELADVLENYRELCRLVATKYPGEIDINKCPPPTDVTPPPTGKPPAFP